MQSHSNRIEILDCIKSLVSNSVGIKQPPSKSLLLQYQYMYHENLANTNIFQMQCQLYGEHKTSCVSSL